MKKLYITLFDLISFLAAIGVFYAMDAHPGLSAVLILYGVAQRFCGIHAEREKGHLMDLLRSLKG